MFKLLTFSTLVGFPTAVLANMAQTVDPLSGGAGWIGAGLLGAVLCAVFFVLLPAKDKQLERKDAQIDKLAGEKDQHIIKLIEDNNKDRNSLTKRYDDERATEREARHERNEKFNTIIIQVMAEHRIAIKAIEDMHSIDADKDRISFDNRSTRIEEAIRQQTKEIKAAFSDALKASCQWAQKQGGCPIPKDTEES